ncbi:hypothetical protein ACFYXD_35335 [Streptomyces platensis]|uniref:hypothetical protein n=1 Tax=Streptomyces platensis TaxID=58346 RepID=UPI0036BA0993
MTATPALTKILGPALVDWLDTDEHRDQAYALHQLIADQDGPYVASAWLIGMNPHLGNDSPLNAIRNGRGVDAREASRTYLDG